MASHSSLSLFVAVGCLVISQALTQTPAGTRTIAACDARIFELEEAMNQLDAARIADAFQIETLHRESLRVKSSRNTLVPFGRLPDEILSRIGMHAIASECPIMAPIAHVLSIFGRLRRVLIATPGLWAGVLMEWSPNIKDLFLTRSQAHPLRFVAWHWLHKDLERITPSFSRVVDLEFNAHILLMRVLTKGLVEGWGSELKGVLQQLRPYLFGETGASGQSQRWDKARLGSWPLCVLHRTSKTAPDTRFVMPHLRRLHISHLQCTLEQLYYILENTTCLEILYLDTSLQVLDTDSHIVLSSRSPLNLPCLSQLHVSDTLAQVSALLDVLRDPSLQFKVRVEQLPTDLAPPSPFGMLRPIISRLRKFWSRTGAPTDVLPATVISAAARPYAEGLAIDRVAFTFSTAAWWQEDRAVPGVYFHAHCAIFEDDPFLHDVETLILECGEQRMLRNTFHFLDPSRLPNAQNLSIRGASFLDAEDAVGDVRTVETLLQKMCTDRARVLRSIEFRGCMDKVEFFPSVVKAGHADRVEWFN